jgi:hypothetical protein
MKFEENYPHLYILFGACFFVGAEEGLTDEEVLADYRSSVSAEELALTHAEMTHLLAADASDWKQAAYEAWRYFANLEENFNWLLMIKAALAAYLATTE